MAKNPYVGLKSMPDLHTAFQVQKSKLELDMLHAPARWPQHVYQRALRDLEDELRDAIQELKSKGFISPPPLPPPAKYVTYKGAVYGIASDSITNPPPTLPHETTFGEIEAFRVWRVPASKLKLISTYTDYEWKPGEVMTAHRKVEDSDDRTFERTGVHAWKSMVEVVEHGEAVASEFCGWMFYMAFGRVKLWGDVVEHRRGYRAEFAKIVGIDDLVSMGQMFRYEGKYEETRNCKSRWMGEELEALRDVYFPERKKKRQD